LHNLVIVTDTADFLLCRSDFTPVRNGLQLLKADVSMDASFLVRIILLNYS